MKKLTINEVVKACNGRLVNAYSNCDEPVISGVERDSRAISEGFLFVAIKGERVDGHNFCQTAFEKGAVAALVEYVPEGIAGPCILVENTVKALQDIAEWYRKLLNFKVVGVTGSVGKTSTKEIIASVLAAKYRVHKTPGNYNNEIGLPLTVLSVEPEVEVAVLEMGIGNFGEMRVLSKIARPDVCVITNIGTAHIEFLKSRDGILQAKSEIFEYMNPKGRIYLNGDDDKLQTVKNVNGITPVFFGFSEECDATVSEYELSGLAGSSMTAVYGNTQLDAHINIPGKHMILNAIAATAIGHDMGMTDEEIITGLEAARTINGRCNIITRKEGFIIDDCYNASMDSMKSAVDTLMLAKGRKIAILGDMLEMGSHDKEFHLEVGQYAAKSSANLLICVGTLGRYIYEGARSQKPNMELIYFKDLEEISAAIHGLVKDDDTILLKASNGMGFKSLIELLTE